jgi:hypothetical protein
MEDYNEMVIVSFISWHFFMTVSVTVQHLWKTGHYASRGGHIAGTLDIWAENGTVIDNPRSHMHMAL